MKKKGLTKKFVRSAVLLSTLLMAVLVIIGLIYYRNRASILKNRAEKAAQSGEYGQAVSLLEQMEEGSERDGLLEEARYQAARKLLEEKKYEEALSAFSKLGTYSDTQEMMLACRYGIADELFNSGKYAEAKDAFFALAGYSDALDRYNGCRYAIALDLEKEDPQAAFDALYELGTFLDARTQAERIAISVTGVEEAGAAVDRMLGITEETEDPYEEIRTALPKNVLAVGISS